MYFSGSLLGGSCRSINRPGLQKAILFDVLDHLNPVISAADASLSRRAIRRRVTEEYQFFCLNLIKALQRSPSAIHIAFDGWTSLNRLPLFGIVAFVLDQEFRPQNVVLGLPNIEIATPKRPLLKVCWIFGCYASALLDRKTRASRCPIHKGSCAPALPHLCSVMQNSREG